MKASDWISVKDRLPKRGYRVFVIRECDGMRFADIATLVEKETYLSNIDMWFSDDGFDCENVTHWQKIVLPKKEKL